MPGIWFPSNFSSRSSRPLIFILLSPSLHFALLICTGTTALLIFVLIFISQNPSSSGSFRFSPSNNESPTSATLGVASKIYVLSLPRRTDRREQMETLRVALGLRWSYYDAIESNAEVVDKILERVRSLRGKDIDHVNEREPTDTIVSTSDSMFWPDNIDALSSSKEPLRTSGSDLWTFSSGNSSDISSSLEPVTCATEDYTITPYTMDLPQYMILSPARIACWHSHLAVIRHIVDDNGTKDDIAVVFEDDIDMEWDIHERLREVWALLPSDWDIVFLGMLYPKFLDFVSLCQHFRPLNDLLGHCWSNESYYPALERTPHRYNNDLRLSGNISDSENPPLPRTRLHPSLSPKCTHAYALSSTGARRLLLYLLYPPFAYSRALDQAFAWLVISERLKSYSVVPSVVVQRKVGGSDVMSGNGSTWKDELVRGVFGN